MGPEVFSGGGAPLFEGDGEVRPQMVLPKGPGDLRQEIHERNP